MLEVCLGEDLRLILFLGVLVLTLLKNVLVINLIPSFIDIVVSSGVMLCIVETHNATCVFTIGIPKSGVCVKMP